MDFHALVRKDLQFLCKKNGIQANLTNIAMADALQALETVEGIEEIKDDLGLHSPKKLVGKSSPNGRTARASSRRAIHRDDSNIKQSSSLPRQQLSLTAKALEVEGIKIELTKALPKTPATRKTAKAAKTQSSRIRSKNDEENEGPSETPKPVESRNIKPIGPITRRSTRLSLKKPLEETDTIECRIRRSTRAKATVEKMGSLCRVGADELEKEDGNKDLGEMGDSNADLSNEEDIKNDKEVESHDLSSSPDGEVVKAVEDRDGGSGDANCAENADQFDAEKGYSCIKLDVEDVMKDQGESHVFSSPRDWVSSNVEVDNPLLVSTEESLPLSETESFKNFRDQFSENKPVKDSGDLSLQKQNEVFSNPLQEEADSCFLREKENLGLKDLEESGNGLLEAGISQVVSELAHEIPKETEKSINLALDSEIVASSIKSFAKSSEQIEVQSNVCEIATSEIIGVPQETEISQDATQDSRTEFSVKTFKEDIQNAAEISFELRIADSFTKNGADAVLAADNLLNHCELATNNSPAPTNLPPLEFTVVTDKSADKNAIPCTDEPSTPGSVDAAPQISSSELQIPAPATKFSETLPEIGETVMHPAVIASLRSSPEEKLPIETAQLSVIQTQLLNSEEADNKSTTGIAEKEDKRMEKENSIQDDNLKNISLIKLRAMYKQKLDSKKNELERGNSMIREDVGTFGSILLDEQKIGNENNEKLEMENNSMIRQENLEFCGSTKQKLGSKIKQSKLDSSNWKQKLNEKDKIQSERKRTPFKTLN